MEDNTKRKISRRDAMKLLAAAVGAATVANLPAEWSKPGLEAGVLPAHAQTSSNLLAGPDVDVTDCQANVVSTVTIAPVATGILMRYDIATTGSVTFNPPGSSTGTVATNPNGIASLPISSFNLYNGSIIVTWSFDNPADGTGSDSQVFTSSAEC